ncbi:MAG: MBL fold metallo-hydrolase [Candidatus Hydrogenedentes bacterium]|nr:MBL fold metallo-hydrolase [Candidatus Hydrogenedentota bacterium]
MQILKGLYQVGGDLMGITWDGEDAAYRDCNSYVLACPGGLLLFDCGCGGTLEQIFANMRYWGLDPEEIKACILTHPHFDHAAGAHLLKARGVKIIAHTETADAIASGDERCCGFLYHKTFTACTADETVADGQHLTVLGLDIEVMHLPGHSMGCTAYFFNHEGRRIVVSGDVIGTLLAGNFGWSGSFDYNKPVYIESLRRFAQVDTDLMLPGHGMIYFHQPRRRVEDAFNAALMEWR